MESVQFTLWDNIHLEEGLFLLSKLKFEEALVELELALKGMCELEDSEKAVAAIQYWQPRIQGQKSSTSSLLTDYAAYSFSPRLNSFKKSLLRYLADQIRKQKHPDFKTIEAAFDLLLSIKDYKQAETFISHLIQQNPDKQEMIFLLAQAQWKNGGKGKANKNYVRALLHAPDKVAIERVENQELKKIILQYEPEMAPAYGWVEGIVPFVDYNMDIVTINDRHQKALNSYHYLQQANAFQSKRDTASATSYRKKLKETAPKLFEVYFELLTSRGN